MQERATIEAIFQEFEATGKVIETLPEDDATVRQSPAEEVLKTSLAQLDAEKPRSVGVAHGLGSPTRPSLTKEKSSSPALVGAGTTATAVGSTVSSDSPAPTPLAKHAGLGRVCETHSAKPIADEKNAAANSKSVALPESTVAKATIPAAVAPDFEWLQDSFWGDIGRTLEKALSIDSTTAERLELPGVRTVGDLLSTDPDRLAVSLGEPQIDSATILNWQWQVELCCDVIHLRPPDARILTACGISLSKQFGRFRSIGPLEESRCVQDKRDRQKHSPTQRGTNLGPNQKPDCVCQSAQAMEDRLTVPPKDSEFPLEHEQPVDH